MSATDESKRAREANEHVTNGMHDDDQPSQRRRRLLKGAASAPMILTLYNGAALARTSNEVTVTSDEKAAAGSPPEYICVTSGTCPATPSGDKCDAGDPISCTPVSNNKQCTTDGGVLITSSSASSLGITGCFTG